MRLRNIGRESLVIAILIIAALFGCNTYFVSAQSSDVSAPVISSGSPAGKTAAATFMSVRTNEPAICRASATANTPYSSMTAQTAQGIIHVWRLPPLTNDITYGSYVRCQDAAGNTDMADYVISFSIIGNTVAPSVAPTVCASPLTEKQTLACPSGQTGSITQSRIKSAYPSCTFGSWSTTANTCKTPTPTTPPINTDANAPVITLTTTPTNVSNIVSGTSVTFNWSATNADICYFDTGAPVGKDGPFATSGSVTFSPTKTTVYAFTCRGTEYQSTTKTVTVAN